MNEVNIEKLLHIWFIYKAIFTYQYNEVLIKDHDIQLCSSKLNLEFLIMTNL